MPKLVYGFSGRLVHGRLIIGLAVIALGVLFTLDNLGLADAHEALRWWPAIIITYGVVRMLGLGRRPAPWSGAMFTLAGTWMLLHSLGVLTRDFSELWPILLILWGFAIVRGGFGARGWRRSVYGVGGDTNLAGEWGVGKSESIRMDSMSGGTTAAPSGAAGAPTPESKPDDPRYTVGVNYGYGSELRDAIRRRREARRGPPFQESASTFSVDVFMSNVSRKVVSQQFESGAVVAVMGGGDIDFRSARMTNGVARLELNLLMGGVNVFVPEDWAVEYQGTAIMGGVEDHSRRPAGEVKGRLVISGVVVMSAIVIKN